MTTDEIRKLYKEFFVSKGHKILPSASLIPDDPTLLLTGAGMNPFKDFFMGTAKPVSTRVVTAQKCLRTGDIENVGQTPRHHTFFEMMGNFSFGDYFKKETIEWAWEFITKWLKLDPEKIWVTVYLDDDEAFDIWTKNVGLPPERVVRLGEKDNFWPASAPSLGPNGPCGPCSEIFIDRGVENGCGNSDCKPGCDCNRFMEFWNLVFQRYDRQDGGKLIPLAQKNIDTGLGLERMASILQNVPTDFDIDIFQPIMKAVEDLSAENTDFSDPRNLQAQRVIADHIRAVVFLINDGVLPSNEGRGYILRRLLRRAVRYGKLLGIQGTFLQKLIPVVIEVMRDGYPELLQQQDRILKIASVEEAKFNETLEQGMILMEEVLRKSQGGCITGEDAFKLYDTYGFPLELTEEIAAEKGNKVDVEGFKKANEAHIALSRRGSEFSGDIWVRETTVFDELAQKLPQTRFVGYTHLTSESMVLAIIKNGKEVKTAAKGDSVQVILDETPFYGESGGQVGDTGTLIGSNLKAEVVNTKKINGLFLHDVKILEGELSTGGTAATPSLDIQTVTASVDEKRRMALRRAHTATHLLQSSLRSILGSHVAQAGSLVQPDHLRFDFSHFEGITSEQLAKIEDLANEYILQDKAVHTEEMAIEEARKTGATALFGEKYGDVVRVVSVESISNEFCGGTHALRTGQIGSAKIISESSVGAGIRRIEAYTGLKAVQYSRKVESSLSIVAESLKVGPSDVPEKVSKLQEDIRGLERQILDMKRGQAANLSKDLLQKAEEIGGVKSLILSVKDMDAEGVKSLADDMAQQLKSGVVLLITETEGKLILVGKSTEDLVKRGFHIGKMIREVAKVVGGGGGGRPDFAQAGGRDVTKIQDALAKAREMVLEQSQTAK